MRDIEPMLDGLTIWKDHAQLEEPALPKSLLFPRYATLPHFEIENTLRITLRFCVETERVIASPLLAFLIESVHTQRHVVRLRLKVMLKGGSSV